MMDLGVVHEGREFFIDLQFFVDQFEHGSAIEDVLLKVMPKLEGNVDHEAEGGEDCREDVEDDATDVGDVEFDAATSGKGHEDDYQAHPRHEVLEELEIFMNAQDCETDHDLTQPEQDREGENLIF